MGSQTARFCGHLLNHARGLRFSTSASITKSQMLEDSIRAAVEAKSYHQIPEFFKSYEGPLRNPNPFSFFSTFPRDVRSQIVDEMLQCFIHLRPRDRPKTVFECLLSFTLESPNPFPLALAILQRTLRSGFTPVPQTHLLLSSAWLDELSQSKSVHGILMEMEVIGYSPDSGTCNYLIYSLCAVDHLEEAIQILKTMSKVGCPPDLDSYGTILGALSALRNTSDALNMLKEMVTKFGLTPRQATILRLASALRANREIWRSVEMIQFLEKEGCDIGFEIFELVLEGCLQRDEFVLAGKVVMGMTRRGFIPYIGVRHKLIEGLAGIGEWKLGSAIRERLTDLNS